MCVCVRAREWLCPAWLSSTQEGGADGTHLLGRAFAADHSVGKEAEVRCRAVAQLVAHDARQRLHGTSSTPQSRARVLRVNPSVPGGVGSLSTHTAHGTAHHRLTEYCRVAAPGALRVCLPDRMGPRHCTALVCVASAHRGRGIHGADASSRAGRSKAGKSMGGRCRSTATTWGATIADGAAVRTLPQHGKRNHRYDFLKCTHAPLSGSAVPSVSAACTR